MTKVVINNRFQSQARQNLLKIAGLKNVSETISPQNGERIFGQVGAVYFNQLAQNKGTDTGIITPPDCPDCPPIEPSTNHYNPPNTPQGCTCRSLDELGDYIEQKASESFCESTPVKDDNQYFPCLTGEDGGELRISCPNDDNCVKITNFGILLDIRYTGLNISINCRDYDYSKFIAYKVKYGGRKTYKIDDFIANDNPLSDDYFHEYELSYHGNNLTLSMAKKIQQKFMNKFNEIANGDFKEVADSFLTHCNKDGVIYCEYQDDNFPYENYSIVGKVVRFKHPNYDNLSCLTGGTGFSISLYWTPIL